MMLGVHTWGGYAEYVKVPVEMTHAIPDDLDFATATVVARHGPTALSMLRDYAKVQPGEWILVMGASGGLGSAGVQVARDLGAKVIGGPAPTHAKAAIDRRRFRRRLPRQDLTEAVRRITGGRGVGVVFENIADRALPRAFAALAGNGRLITGAHGGAGPLDVQRLYCAASPSSARGQASADDVAHCLRAAADEPPRLDRPRLAVAEAALAHRIVAQRSGTGKWCSSPEHALMVPRARLVTRCSFYRELDMRLWLAAAQARPGDLAYDLRGDVRNT
jgi:NADPH:quinone reductase-like Zn-dependent oxidoreductase